MAKRYRRVCEHSYCTELKAMFSPYCLGHEAVMLSPSDRAALDADRERARNVDLHGFDPEDERSPECDHGNGPKIAAGCEICG